MRRSRRQLSCNVRLRKGHVPSGNGRYLPQHPEPRLRAHPRRILATASVIPGQASIRPLSSTFVGAPLYGAAVDEAGRSSREEVEALRELAVRQRIADLETLMRAAGLVPEAFTGVADVEQE